MGRLCASQLYCAEGHCGCAMVRRYFMLDSASNDIAGWNFFSYGVCGFDEN
jgi:hypothetical protein